MTDSARAWVAAARRHSAIIVLFVGFPLTVAFVLLVIKPVHFVGYPVSGSAKATFAMGVVAPLCAACAAYQAGRLRTMWNLHAPAARSTSLIQAVHFLPIWFAGCLCLLLASLVIGIESDLGVFLPDAMVVLVAIFAVAGYVSFGAIVGWFLQPALSVPLALCVSYLWVALTPTSDIWWLRHLTGDVASCCANDKSLSSRVVLALVMVGTVLAVAATLLTIRAVSWQRLAASTILVVGGASMAVWLVSPLDSSPTQSRQTALVCAGEQPQVCVWPEHGYLLPETTRQAAAVREQFAQQGIELPSVASEAPGSSWRFGVGPAYVMTPEFTRANLIMGLSINPAQAACLRQSPGQPIMRYQEQDVLRAFLMIQVGMPGDTIDQRVPDPEVKAKATAIVAANNEERSAWFAKARAAYSDCDTG